MATVTHAGRNVISDNEGGWHVSPGSTGHEVGIVRMARSTKLKFKDFGKAGYSVSLNIDFVGSADDFDDFRDDLELLYDMKIGDLIVPVSGGNTITFPDCVFVGTPSWGEVIALADNENLYNVTVELVGR